MKKLKPRLLSVSICAILMASAAAHAQSSTNSDSDNNAAQSGQQTEQAKQLQTITVTARGVSELLQNTPLPITAVPERIIDKKGLNNIHDIAEMTPSFSFPGMFGRSLERPVIRGMSNILGEPNASFFINGIFVNGSFAAYGLENIKRVEVIRGPQAAQFGRRTFSGAINFITKRPGADPGTTLSLGYGNYGQQKIGLFYSDRTEDGSFGFDVSYYSRQNDGIFHNEISGKDDLGGRDSESLSLAAQWTPTLNFELIGRVSQTKVRDQMFPIARMGSDALNCYMPEYTGQMIGGRIPILSSRRTGAYCGEVSAPESYAINTPAYLAAGYFPGTKYDYLRTSLRANYYFDNGWTLSTTTAYNEASSYQGVDQDYSGARGLGGSFESIAGGSSYDWSENISLSSDQSLPVSGTVGLYYYSQTAGSRFAGSLAGFFLPGTRSVVPAVTNPADETTGKAVYGMINWDINESWSASLEARYAKDELSISGVDVRALAGETYRRPYALDKTYTNFTPRATVTYHLNDAINIYALASKGTKPGGFNLEVYRADISDEGREHLIDLGYQNYDQEVAWNYELGVKSTLLNGRLRLNATVYQIDWENQQLTRGAPVERVDGSTYATSYVANIGESRIRGFELSSNWLFAPGWMANFTYSYTDAQIIRYSSQSIADLFCDAAAPSITAPCASAVGNALPLVPEQLASLGLLYTGTFDNGWGYDVSFDTRYRSDSYASSENLTILPGSVRSDFRFNLRPTENLQISAYVNNVFDDDTPSGVMAYIDPTGFVAVPAAPPLTGSSMTFLSDYAVTPTLPRMYGVELTYRF